MTSGAAEVRIRTEARFRPLPVKMMRDHSFDPIHEMSDWDVVPRRTGRLDIVIRPSRDAFNGVEFAGFSYHYEYDSADVPIFWLLDSASWELDGDIMGATVYSQSSCSAPAVTFDKDTAWSTEGFLFFLVEQSQNPVMTHNLPRWVGHGAFDFQFKNGRTLIGVFDRVELIRSVQLREPGKAELKCFDKHLFDQSNKFSSAAKKILLNVDAQRTEMGQKNLWTWVYDEVDARALREFGLRETPTYPVIHQNYWNNFTVDSYYADLLPAAAAMGVKRIYVDNLKKSSMTEGAPLPGVFNWNMCAPHEFEISQKLGGTTRVKAFVEECARRDIRVICWTNNAQSLASPLNRHERAEGQDYWYVLLEDTRQKYGGAYAGCMSVLDMSVPAARKHLVDTHVKILNETGMSFFFDSFYNLGFMPISYVNLSPRTMWRGLLAAVKEMQDAGIEMLIESFGPWGSPMHGHPSSYNMGTIFACYRVGVGNDYTTVPGQQQLKDLNPSGADGLYYTLAHKACTLVPLFVNGVRVDRVWGDDFKRALADYHAVLPAMRRRYLQEDGLSVLWHDDERRSATLFNFRARTAPLPGRVRDITTGQDLPARDAYELQAMHTYSIIAPELPTNVR
jgi:hypothetical protein